MKVVAFVPIRLNSKRVSGKNLKPLNGKPLMNYLLDTLTNVNGIDEVYCFCSQNSIIDLLPQNVKYLQRDSTLDSDTTLGSEIYDAFVSQVDADVYVLSHATSPFLKKETIENALNQVLNGDFDSAFSAEKIQSFVWYKGNTLNYELKHVPRTQDITPVYVETSAFFIFKKDVWTCLHQRIGEKPYIAVVDKIEGVDIDWPEDFKFAEMIAKLK